MSMSSSPTRAPVDGTSDTFVLAQNILRLAATPSSLPSRENLEIAVAVYQAAMKLQSPPIYEASGSNDIVNIQRQLDDLKQEADRRREETSRALIRLEAKLDHLLAVVEKQGAESDIRVETLELETRQCKTELEQLKYPVPTIGQSTHGETAITDRAEMETEIKTTQATQALNRNNMTSAPWRGAIQSTDKGGVRRSKIMVDLSGIGIGGENRGESIALNGTASASNVPVDESSSSSSDEESPTPNVNRATALSVQPKWKPAVPKKGKKSKKMAKVGR